MLIDTSHCCPEHANEAIDTLFLKAASEPPGDGIWKPHENPFIRRLVELFTERGLTRIAGIQSELARWLDHATHQPGPLPAKPPGSMRRWSKSELALVKLYLETLPPDQFTLDDWMMVVDYLVQRYFPADDLIAEADWLAYRASMMGKVQARLKEISETQADFVLAAIPGTVAAAASQGMLTAAQQEMIAYGRLRAAESVVALSDSMRHALRRLIMDYAAARAHGDPSVRESLQTRLLDHFGALNRDWRRIAITEAGECANQGFIAAQGPGARVRRVEQYANACPFCRMIDGRVLEVVPPDAPNKNGDTQVWVGKTNVGRSAAPRKRTPDGFVDRTPDEMWWIAAGTQHPHCRGTWVAVQEPERAGDEAFTKWLSETLAKV